MLLCCEFRPPDNRQEPAAVKPYESLALAILLSVSANTLVFAESEPTHVARFEQLTRPANWGVNFGHWEPADGHLVAKQLEKDNHAAASRWKIPLADATIRLKLRIGSAKQFHIGFDPAPGSLKKKGHLYSLIVMPGGAMIKKHKDKADPKSTDETLTTASFKPGIGASNEWAEIELTAKGDTVRAQIGKFATLEASDPTFHVAKPGIVFRVVGGEALIDDVEVTVHSSVLKN